MGDVKKGDKKMNMLNENKTEYAFKSDFISRVRNFSMTSSDKNSLMPLMEAITNSLQSLYERYNEAWIKKGEVNIFLYLDEKGEYPENIEIEDNGAGFNTVNFDSFLTFDSAYKMKIGGKGIGRFSWLKVFEKAHITSVFFENGKKYKREFDFVLEDHPIQNHVLIEEKNSLPMKTTVRLEGMKSGYRSRFPSKMETVIRKVLIHFLPSLIAGTPSINILSGNQDSSDIKTIFSNSSYNLKIEEIETERHGKLYLKHMFLDKKGFDAQQGHNLFLSANNRIVSEHKLNNQLGLLKPLVYEEHTVLYTGVLTGDVLDNSVFGERNSFDLSDDIEKDIIKIAVNRIKENYLKNYIEDLIEQKTEKLKRIVKQNPRFKYLVSEPEEWAKRMSLSAQNDEDLIKELSIYDYRENQKIEKEKKKISDNGYTEEEMNNKLSETISRITEISKSNLAEYVARRKVIIDILRSRLEYADKDKKTMFKEEAIHKIICPMRVSSDDIEVKDHNLWIIDDNLSFYKYITSDKQIKQYLSASTSDSRPDLALFNGCLSFGKGESPVVIVEFKRPERDDYTNNDNPIQQIYNYIDEFRDKKVRDAKGKTIRKIDKDTPFFCYVICDITEKFEKILSKEQIHTPLIGHRGFFGFNSDYNAYFEVIDFEEMIDSARNRNSLFFDELGIEDD